MKGFKISEKKGLHYMHMGGSFIERGMTEMTECQCSQLIGPPEELLVETKRAYNLTMHLK